MNMRKRQVNKNDQDKVVADKLEILREVPPREINQAIRGKNLFMMEAQQLKSSISLPVSSSVNNNRIWSKNILHLFQRKEPFPLFASVLSILLVVILLISGGVITVSAAQNSIPGEPLWNFKVFNEDLRLNIARSPESQFELQLGFVEGRILELSKLIEQPEDASVDTLENFDRRMTGDLNNLFSILVNLEDTQLMMKLMTLARNEFQVRARELSGLDNQLLPNSKAELNRIQLTIQERMRWLDEGIKDPDQLRTRLRLQDNNPENGEQNGFEAPPGKDENGKDDPQNGSGTGSDNRPADSGNENGSGPTPTRTRQASPNSTNTPQTGEKSPPVEPTEQKKESNPDPKSTPTPKGNQGKSTPSPSKPVDIGKNKP